ncbi:CdiA C-terminal domain-containing protein [Streptomyces sp. NPDC002784]
MAVLMVAAALYGVVQLCALSWPTRSVRLSTVLLAVLAGVYACGTAAAVLEFTYTRLVAAHTDQSLSEVVNTTAYTTAPWTEEVLKAAPLLLAGMYPKVRRQWGLADFTVLGAALGAGFGLLEALLRYSLDADRALSRHGGWIVPDSLSAPYIPGPGEVFTSWLPAPAAALHLGRTGEVLVPTFAHLAWTALAGLAVGILWRAPSRLKPLALIPFSAAVTHHTLNNYVSGRPAGDARDWLEHLDAKLWAAPLLALLLATAADMACLHRGKRHLPGILLAPERADGDTAAALIRYAFRRFPWTPLIALRFVLLRRALCYCLGAPAATPETLESLRRSVADIATRIDATDNAWAWRDASAIRRHMRASLNAQASGSRRRWLLTLVPCILALPAVIFLGVGSFKSTAELQDHFRTGVGPKILLAFAVAALAWIGWQLVTLIRTWQAATAHPLAEQLARHRFRIGTASGSAAAGGILLWRGLGEAGADGTAIPAAHLLEALDRFLVYLGFALLLLSLLALFPPGAAFAFAGATVTSEAAVAAALAARLGLAGVALMAVGAEGGRGGSGESGGANPGKGSIDESEKSFSPKERRIAETLQTEGRSVRALKESQVDGRRTPDATVNGVPTEFKTLDPGAASNSVKNTLNTAKKQARDAVVDARGSGLGEAQAREGLEKFLRNNPPGRMNSIRIIGDDYNVLWP